MSERVAFGACSRRRLAAVRIRSSLRRESARRRGRSEPSVASFAAPGVGDWFSSIDPLVPVRRELEHARSIA
jgi:hypothetical protein